MGDDMADRKTKHIPLSDSVKRLVSNVEKNHERLSKSRRHHAYLSGSYKKFVRNVLGILKEGIAKNEAGVVIAYRGLGADDPMEKQYQKPHSEWIKKIIDLTTFLPSDHNEQEEKSPILENDQIISLLKEEPRDPSSTRRTFFEEKHAGLSMLEIETLPYPLSENDIEKITYYLLDTTSEKKLGFTERIIRHIFVPHHFRGLRTAFNPTNKELTKRINGWLTNAALQIVDYDPNKPINHSLVELLKTYNPITSSAIMMLYMLTAHPYELDPESKPGDNIPWEKYPLYEQIALWYTENLPEEKRFDPAYADEIGQKYFLEILVPKLKKRLNTLGILENQTMIIEAIRESVTAIPYEETLLENILIEFSKRCGEQLLKKLETNKERVANITQLVWSNIVGNVHYLPIHEGYNIVDFSSQSLPSIIGLKAIRINASGNKSVFKTNIIFELQDSNFQINGIINEKGEALFRGNIEKTMPGLHTILQHIAVLTLHDLVIQEKQQKNRFHLHVGERRKTEEHPQIDENQHRRPIPRQQTDDILIKSVHSETSFKPRRVELYKRYVGHGKEFENLCRLYEYGKNKGWSEQFLELVKKQISLARSKLWSPSTKKIENIPPLFRLDTTRDPITGEEVYLKTWVAEHTSPKPTKDELESPLKLYTRYYQNSSALSFLDQMLPWIIGL